MFRDFGISLHIPLDRLCPPVPNRLNYVLWIQDIILAHSLVLDMHKRVVRGIDIGTGACAIYPFLVCKLEPDWKIVGTELDEVSYASAEQNVAKNDMQLRIEIRKATVDGPILFPLDDDAHFEFTMCNPPFYSSLQEVSELAKEKELPPNAVCTGAEIEMVYPDGGEAGFVRRMVEESVKFGVKCKWYTTMLGKLSSIISIIELLRQFSITNYAITEFVQGQTRRWAIAWSITDTRLPDSVARIPSISSNHTLYPLLPPRNTLVQSFACPEVPLREALADTFRLLDMEGVQVSAKQALGSSAVFLIEAQANIWSRSARRTRKREARTTEMQTTPSTTNPGLTCSVRVIAQDSSLDNAAIEFQWIFGRDRALFESFMGHISRKVGAKIQARSN